MADDKFRKNALDTHNAWRAKHGVPAMKLSNEMNKIAQKWADHIAKGDMFQHSKPEQRQYKGDQMGENIAMKWTSNNLDFTGRFEKLFFDMFIQRWQSFQSVLP